MAEYKDLYGLFNNSELRNRVVAATTIAAYGLLAATPTVNDRAWFSAVMANPKGEGSKAFIAVLAANSGLSTEAVTGASDATILSAVEAIRPTLIAALAGA